MLIEAVRAQPAGLSPIHAIRGALRDAFGSIQPAEAARIRERTALTLVFLPSRATTVEPAPAEPAPSRGDAVVAG